jgi:hypothetical protein
MKNGEWKTENGEFNGLGGGRALLILGSPFSVRHFFQTL